MNSPLTPETEESSSLLGKDDALSNERVGPPLLTSVPSLNEAASFLADKTSYITSCFSVEPESREDYARELMTFGGEVMGASLAKNGVSSRGGSVVSSASETKSTAVDAPSIQNATMRFTGESSQSATAVVQSTIETKSTAVDAPSIQNATMRITGESSQSPTAVVQSTTATNSAGEVSQNVTAVVQPANSNQTGISMFQGLIERVQRTVRGSADDIGWLQRDPDMPPVEDGTDRFAEILDEIRHGVHRLPNSFVYLLVPGLFSNHGPLYFVNTKTCFSKMGLTCHIAKIHSEASVEKNAREIKEYIEEMYWGANKRVLLLGHSKGGVDAAAALSMYWPDLKDKVAGLALAQSPYGGSPIASDILREGQLGDYVNMRKLMEILICKVIKGDLQALEDLTYERRKQFLRKHHLPRELPVISFHTEANISPAVLATLSRVAHAELPVFSAAQQPTMLPVVIPLGAAMAACAQLLQTRYGEKSDGLVTCRDAEVPGSVVVRPKRKLDHAWMVYSSLNDDPAEADASQVCEALLLLLVNVGEKKKHELDMKDE